MRKVGFLFFYLLIPSIVFSQIGYGDINQRGSRIIKEPTGFINGNTDSTTKVITGGTQGDFGDVDGGVEKIDSNTIKCGRRLLIPPLHISNTHFDRIFGEELKEQQPENFKSVLQLQSEEYSQYNFTKQEQWDSLYAIKNPNASTSKIFQTPAPSSCTLNKIVYGWNPYWIAASQYNAYNYSLLSDLCYFSYDVNATTGGYTSIHNWLTSGAVNNAFAAGCRVSLCATLFSNHNTFLNSVSARQNFITTMINLLQARGATGVNIDFEGMGSSSTVNFTQFMIDLCTQMHAAIPGSKVSIAMPSVDWSSTMNIGALNPYVDLFIIMGYDYHWGSSANAGPCSPLYHGNYWGTICCSSSMAYYLHAGATPAKLCLGVPYYGYDYPTSTNGLNSTTTGSGSAKMYYTTKANTVSLYTQQWDNNSATPYYMYNSGGWHQAWYDDENSLTAKYDMVNQMGIGGIGIWALGYDDGYAQCWNAIRDEFTTCKAPPACSGTITDIGGPGNYFNYENWAYTIAPQNANSVSLTFNSFDLELNYDFLKVYNGPNTLSPLIGTYTGATNPGTLTANSGKMTLKFTSDVSTVHQGFKATWNCSYLNTGIDNLSDDLHLNVYPNPFNGEATIAYNLSAQSEVEIKLIDLLGKEIIISPDHSENPGEHQLVLDANKYALAQGLYLLKMRMNEKESFVKVVLQ